MFSLVIKLITCSGAGGTLLSHSASLRLRIGRTRFALVHKPCHRSSLLIRRNLFTWWERYCAKVNIVTRMLGKVTLFVKTDNSYCNAFFTT